LQTLYTNTVNRRSLSAKGAKQVRDEIEAAKMRLCYATSLRDVMSREDYVLINGGGKLDYEDEEEDDDDEVVLDSARKKKHDYVDEEEDDDDDEEEEVLLDSARKKTPQRTKSSEKVPGPQRVRISDAGTTKMRDRSTTNQGTCIQSVACSAAQSLCSFHLVLLAVASSTIYLDNYEDSIHDDGNVVVFRARDKVVVANGDTIQADVVNVLLKNMDPQDLKNGHVELSLDDAEGCNAATLKFAQADTGFINNIVPALEQRKVCNATVNALRVHTNRIASEPTKLIVTRIHFKNLLVSNKFLTDKDFKKNVVQPTSYAMPVKNEKGQTIYVQWGCLWQLVVMESRLRVIQSSGKKDDGASIVSKDLENALAGLWK
jgi:hypothetical protein